MARKSWTTLEQQSGAARSGFFGLIGNYRHVETLTVDTDIPIIDYPDVQQVPSGFDSFTVATRHEVAVFHDDLSIAPIIGDTLTFNGKTYRLDDIVSDNGVQVRAVVVEIPL
ncbi:MAG: hypothetical protein KJN72_12130 [Woeseia sp.]|nr:hypothetical protein [Woeseia sp.]